MRASLLAAVAVAVVAGPVACGPGLVKLDPKKARRIELELVGGGTTVCTNARVPELRARVTYDNGKVFETRTPSNPNGTLRPLDLEWSSDVGGVDETGTLRLPPSLLAWYDRTFSVRTTVPERPDLTAELPLQPRFDCGGFAVHDGDGGDWGGRGARGARVDVAMAYVDTTLNGRLILVRVSADNDVPRYFLVDKRGTAQRFLVSAQGGPGGPGASGDAGSDGSRGSDGSSGSSGGTCQNGGDGGNGSDGGDGGNGGDAGDGGDGGDGGLIEVTYPAGFPDLPAALAFSVDGGPAGRGGEGGRAGNGGDGGNGGSGGSAGSTTDSDGNSCTTSRGRDGTDGTDGTDGAAGSDGRAGRPGAPGQVTTHAVDLDQAFAAELAAGWPLVRP